MILDLQEKNQINKQANAMEISTLIASEPSQAGSAGLAG